MIEERYLPPYRQFLYLPSTNFMMVGLQRLAQLHARGPAKAAAVIRSNHDILGSGVTLTSYPYAILRALEDAHLRRLPTRDADLYLWGRQFCYPAEWEAIDRARLRHVYLLQGGLRASQN